VKLKVGYLLPFVSPYNGFALTSRPVSPPFRRHTAQCASLAREGAVYAAGSEDMDTLTFGGSILYRHLTFSEAKKAPIMEVSLEKALEGLEMDMSTVGFFCFVISSLFRLSLLLFYRYVRAFYLFWVIPGNETNADSSLLPPPSPHSS
jgi:hypothetical protein